MAFLLHHEIVGAPGAQRTAFVLHGALGSGQNFRGFIKKLAQRRSDFCFVLVDLRAHGDSHPAPAPHTLSSCATDLVTLADELRKTRPEIAPVSCVIGHSLGGKVALEYARSHSRGPTQIWALDSNPGSQDVQAAHEIQHVMRAVRNVGTPIASRGDVVAAIEAQGLSRGLAQWMTTNLRRRGDQYEWAFDLDAIGELLLDYFECDLWPFIEAPQTTASIHLVVAERSDRWSDEMRRRALRLKVAGTTELHDLPDAGHWVHVDNPVGLLDLIAPRL